MVKFINEKANDEIALISNDLNISYGELKDKINYFSKKFCKGSINILICSNTIESVILYLSLLNSGAITLLLSNQLSKENIIIYAKKYKVSHIISEKELHFDKYQNCWNYKNYFIYKNINAPIIKNTNLALLLTTSGSTGSPKVVRISKKNLL